MQFRQVNPLFDLNHSPKNIEELERMGDRENVYIFFVDKGGGGGDR